MDPAPPPPSIVEFPSPKWPPRSRLPAVEHTPAAAIIAAATVVTAAPWLAGGQVLWGQAAVLVAIGLLLAIWAPRAAPHRLAGWALLGVLGLCTAQFWPAALGGGAALRHGLADRLALDLAPTISPQPWLSLDHTIVLLAGLAWWWWCATMLRGRPAREETAKACVLGITSVAIFGLCGVAGLVTQPAWWSEFVSLGPFPNKNQMADLMATWAIVAAGCGVASLQRRRWTGLFWLAIMLVLGWTTFESMSRGGTFVLLAGLAVLALREGLATRELRPFAIGLSFVLCALSLFLAFGGDTLQRSLRLFQAMRESTSSDFRMLIYRDALHLIHEAPWPGLGLGNFEPVFALHREVSAAPSRVLHPESDWLWLAAELGWLAPAVALLLVLPGLRNPFRSELRERSPILDAAAIAGLAFLVHGLVDVSGHRLGSAVPALLLLGLGIRRSALEEPRRLWPCFFRGAALAILLLAVGWLPFAPRALAAWGRSPVAHARQEALAANAALTFPKAEQLATEALRRAPLDWELYFIRAVAELYQEKLEMAHTDFRRARQLESSNPVGPLAEGQLWAYFSSDRCREAFEAALLRGTGGSLDIYRQIVAVGRTHPNLFPTIRDLAALDWDRRLAYLEALPAADFPTEFAALLADDPTLQKPSEECLGSLLALCENRGDRPQLLELLEESPRVHATAWRTLARLQAEDRDFEPAVELALARLQVPVPELTAPSLEAAQVEFARHPNNLVAGYHQFRAQMAAGDVDAALPTLSALKALPQCPRYVPYLRGKLLAERREWEAAWSELAPLF